MDKELPSINIQNYHPSLVESYRDKFLLNHDPKISDTSSFLNKLNPAIFSLNPLQNQYSKSLNLNSLHDSLNRVQSNIDEQQQKQQQPQSLRVKNLYCLDTISKQLNVNADVQPSTAFKIQNATSSNMIPNDKNNNKNTNSYKEKNEPQLEKSSSSNVIHLNTKTGVSLKCAYCVTSREDFKSR